MRRYEVIAWSNHDNVGVDGRFGCVQSGSNSLELSDGQWVKYEEAQEEIDNLNSIIRTRNKLIKKLGHQAKKEYAESEDDFDLLTNRIIKLREALNHYAMNFDSKGRRAQDALETDTALRSIEPDMEGTQEPVEEK